MYFYDGKVSLIDEASVTIILCLHVLIAHRVFIIILIWNMLIIFSENRCLKCYRVNNLFCDFITWLICVCRACANAILPSNKSLVCLQSERRTLYQNSKYIKRQWINVFLNRIGVNQCLLKYNVYVYSAQNWEQLGEPRLYHRF